MRSDHNFDRRGNLQDLRNKLCSFLRRKQQLLKVVQDEQYGSFLQKVQQELLRFSRIEGEVEHIRNGQNEDIGRGGGGQRHKVDSICKATFTRRSFSYVPSHMKRQASFADTARANQG